ncbi:hypothetical protein ABW20_dc0101839 [Dactylellina cionopaga]|nr:hypothetical protein ABW20_dc0101839 [Dactylellina cionopaga]
MEVIGGVSSIIAIVEVGGKIGLLCAKYITEVRDAKNDAERIMKETQFFCTLLTDVENLLNGPVAAKLKSSQALGDALQDGKKVLEQLQSNLERGLTTGDDEKPKKSSFLRKITKGLKSESLKWPFKKKEFEEVVKSLRDLNSTITLALQIDNLSIVTSRDQRINLEKLPVVKGAMFRSLEDQHEPLCLPETRSDILRVIEEWVKKPRAQGQGQSDGRIFWLRGMAGTGKSTVARTVARYLTDHSQLGASFFFKRTQAQRNNASGFFPTIAYSLAQHLPSLVPHINAAIEGDPDVFGRAYKEQFEKLLFDPFSQLESTPTVVIVIDALDECGNEEDISLILIYLGKLTKLERIDLRLFITSRPELGLLTGFQKLHEDKIHYYDKYDGPTTTFWNLGLVKKRSGSL